MLKIEDAISYLENVSNMPGENMTRNDNDIFIRKTAENAIELIKEQQAEIARLKGILSHIWTRRKSRKGEQNAQLHT